MKRELVIDNFRIADDTAAYVIAEIGHNHQGSVEKAKEMFDRARECGVNAVKLQKRDNRTLFTRELYDAPYESENSFGSTYGAHREALEFNAGQYAELIAHAKKLGLTFFATAFDQASADTLASLDMPAYKLASGDLRNTPLLKHVAGIGKPMILSTGGGEMVDVRRAVDTVMPINSQLCILQCTASYPAEADVMNLRVIETFRREFPSVVIGLSDHQNGIALSSVAYVLGARVIEKHFTLSRAAKGTDHAFSLEPAGMRKLVRDLHRTEQSLGDGVKRSYDVEKKPLYKMAKKLTAARDLPAGHILTADDIAVKSPGDGLPPFEFDRVLGMVTTRAVKADEGLSFDFLGSPVA